MKINRLENKVAIITGSAAGMGREMAVLFASEGAKVVVADIATEGGEETVSLIKENGGETVFIHVCNPLLVPLIIFSIALSTVRLFKKSELNNIPSSVKA